MKTAESRSRIYSVFSAYMAFPTADIWQESLREEKLILFENSSNSLPYANNLNASVKIDQIALEDLKMVHTMNFDTGVASVSLHGRSYSTVGDRKLFEELFRFYEHFGLDFSSSTNEFWPDSLETELEFMHYLTYLEGLTGDRAFEIKKAQRDFLARHLGPLVNGIQSVLNKTNVPVYTHLTAQLAEFVNTDLEYLNESIGDRIKVKQVGI